MSEPPIADLSLDATTAEPEVHEPAPRPPPAYTIILARTLADLAVGVNEAADSDYFPLGAPQFMPGTEHGRSGKPWLQAMFNPALVRING